MNRKSHVGIHVIEKGPVNIYLPLNKMEFDINWICVHEKIRENRRLAQIERAFGVIHLQRRRREKASSFKSIHFQLQILIFVSAVCVFVLRSLGAAQMFSLRTLNFSHKLFAFRKVVA